VSVGKAPAGQASPAAVVGAVALGAAAGAHPTARSAAAAAATQAALVRIVTGRLGRAVPALVRNDAVKVAAAPLPDAPAGDTRPT
jgi:hypothetical protein